MTDFPSRDGGPSPAALDMPPDALAGASPIKRARLEQGLTLEGLASLTKVTPAKLDALENGRYGELPDPAFARALAMTVCRVLKIDPAAVMATLPSARPISLGASESREVPFQNSRTRLRLHTEPRSAVPWGALLAPRWLAPIGLLVAAAAVYFLPQDMGWMPSFMRPTPSSAGTAPASTTVTETIAVPVPLPAPPAASSASPAQPAQPGASVPDAAALGVAQLAAQPGMSLPAASSAALVGGTPVQPAVPNPPATATSVAAAATPLVLAVSDAAWVEVRDARGRRLISREVRAGETLGLDGPAPLRVKIGNADAVRLTYRGDPIELAAFTRGRVATLELK